MTQLSIIQEKINTIKASFDDRLKEIENKKREMAKAIQADFSPLVSELLKESKVIEFIRWNQYTPYFNDGDECTFSSNTDYLEVNGIDEYDDNQGALTVLRKRVYENGKWIDNVNADPYEISILEGVKSFLSSIPDEFYKDLFGDHMRVTVYKNGNIETEEYEHD